MLKKNKKDQSCHGDCDHDDHHDYTTKLTLLKKNALSVIDELPIILDDDDDDDDDDDTNTIGSISNNNDNKSKSSNRITSTIMGCGSRPWDTMELAGPPASPIPFDEPIIKRGRRRNGILMYDARTKKRQLVHNVLFRDLSNEYYGETPEKALRNRTSEAYWPIPDKGKIKTIMGHIEICYVLKRCPLLDDDDDDDFSDDDDYSSSDSEDDEDDVVFEMTARRVAVKVNYGERMKKYRGQHTEDPLQEVAAMQSIGNDNVHVMGIVDALYEGNNLNVVMPYAGNGDLFDLLTEYQERGKRCPENVAKNWFRQMLNGIRHIHDKGVCHRDLSPENVMIDDNDNAIIIDMGMAIRIPYNDPLQKGSATTVVGLTDIRNDNNGSTIALKRLMAPQGTCGKLPYMSPEIYQNQNPFDGESIDVWSAGVILFCMVTGNRSYDRPHVSDPLFYWMTRDLSKLLHDWNVHHLLSNECIDLLRNMLQTDPRLRYTLDEVSNHPWFIDHHNNDIDEKKNEVKVGVDPSLLSSDAAVTMQRDESYIIVNVDDNNNLNIRNDHVENDDELIDKLNNSKQKRSNEDVANHFGKIIIA